MSRASRATADLPARMGQPQLKLVHERKPALLLTYDLILHCKFTRAVSELTGRASFKSQPARRVSCSALPHGGRGWPAASPCARHIFSPKTIFAGRHTAPDSTSLSNKCVAVWFAPAQSSARRQGGRNPCAAGFPPTPDATSFWWGQ